MIKPALQDDAFLSDVAEAYKRPDIVNLWWLGQSGFLLGWMEDFAIIDPYLSDSLTTKYAATDKPHVRMSRRVVDPARLNFVFLILSTHNHTDHLDSQSIKPILTNNPCPQIIAPAANLDVVSERSGLPVSDLWGLDDGKELVVAGFRITGIPSAHETIERDALGRCRYLGYVIRMNNFTLYHSGDTLSYDGLAERLRPFSIDVALLPINGRAPERRVAGNMNGREATQLAKQIGAKLVIPCHYDMFEFNTADPADEFIPECKRIGQKYRVLRQGERWSSSELD